MSGDQAPSVDLTDEEAEELAKQGMEAERQAGEQAGVWDALRALHEAIARVPDEHRHGVAMEARTELQAYL